MPTAVGPVLLLATALSDVREVIQSLSGVAQICFFGVTATLAVLTYRKARLTLLQPIRTEVFKEQVKLLTEVLDHFVGKREYEFRRDFHFDELFEANACRMYDEFARTMFDLIPDRKSRPYRSELCPGFIVTNSYANKHYKRVDQPVDEFKPEPRPETGLDRSGRLAIWGEYEHGEIKIPKGLTEKTKELERLRSMPLLPAPLVGLLTDFLQLVDENTSEIGVLLTEMAKSMPQHYPTIEAMRKSSYGWMHFPWLDRLKKLEPKSIEICDYVRRYCHSDEFTING